MRTAQKIPPSKYAGIFLPQNRFFQDLHRPVCVPARQEHCRQKKGSRDDQGYSSQCMKLQAPAGLFWIMQHPEGKLKDHHEKQGTHFPIHSG